MSTAGASGRRTLLAASTAACGAFVLAAPAQAEIRKLELERGVLAVQAGESKDELTIAATKKTVTVTDRDPITVKPDGCEGGEVSAPKVVTCARDDVKRVEVDLGDARDLLEGKLGNDTLEGSQGSDELLGGLGNDELIGKGGKDLLDGGPGRDRGDGGGGKDRCFGVERAKKGACS